MKKTKKYIINGVILGAVTTVPIVSTLVMANKQASKQNLRVLASAETKVMSEASQAPLYSPAPTSDNDYSFVPKKVTNGSFGQYDPIGFKESYLPLNNIDLSHHFKLTYQINFKEWASASSPFGAWGGVQANGVSATISCGSFNQTATSNQDGFGTGGKTSWGKSDSYSGSVTKEVLFDNLTGLKNSPNPLSLSINSKIINPHRAGNTDGAWFNISSVTMLDTTLNKMIPLSHTSGEIDTGAAGTRGWTSKVDSLFQNRITTTLSDNLILDKLVMSPSDFNSLDETKLKTLLTSKGNAISFSSNPSGNVNQFIISDFAKKTDSVVFNIQHGTTNTANPTHLTDKTAVVLPVAIVSLEDLFSIDETTGKELDYTIPNQPVFWDKNPSLNLVWNKDYFSAIEAFDRISSVKNKVIGIAWRSQAEKDEALKAVDSLKINEFNIDLLAAQYNDTHVLAVDSLDQPKWYEYISSNKVTQTTKDFIYNILGQSKLKLSLDLIDPTDNSKVLGTEDLSFDNIFSSNFKIQLPSTIIKANENNQVWKVRIKNLTLVNNGLSFKTGIHLSRAEAEYKSIYHLNVHQEQTYLDWTYNFQAKPQDISQDLVFTGLNSQKKYDANFNVMENDGSGHFAVKDQSQNGFSYAWYPYDTATQKESNNSRLSLTRVYDSSVTKHYVDNPAVDSHYVFKFIDPADNQEKDFEEYLKSKGHVVFDPRKVHYVFNEPLQLTINPPKGAYELQKVSDVYGNENVVLEDWTDGRLSHHVDKVFGAVLATSTPPQYKFTKEGMLTEGEHKISADIKGLHSFNTAFNIEIDTNPPVVNTDASASVVTKTMFHTFGDHSYDAYLSTGSVDINITDQNLKSAKILPFSAIGNKYIDLPVKQTVQNGIPLKTAHVNLDYAGFFALVTEDYAGNKSVQYIYIDPSGNFDGASNILSSPSAGGTPTLMALTEDKNNPSQSTRRYVDSQWGKVEVLKVDPTQMGAYASLTFNLLAYTNAKVSSLDLSSGKVAWDSSSIHLDTPSSQQNAMKAIYQSMLIGQAPFTFNPTTLSIQSLEDNPTASYADGFQPFDILDGNSADQALQQKAWSPFMTTDQNQILPSFELRNAGGAITGLNHLLKIEYESPFGADRKTIIKYIYITDRDLEHLPAPIEHKGSNPFNGLSDEYVTSATLTEEVKHGRELTLQAEKDSFMKLVEWKRAEANMVDFLLKYDQELNHYGVALQALEQDIETERQSILSTPVYQAYLSKHEELTQYEAQLDSSGIKPTSDASHNLGYFDDPKWVSLKTEANNAQRQSLSLITSLESLPSKRDDALTVLKNNNKELLDHKKLLEDKVAETKKAYDEAKAKWEASLVFTKDGDLVKGHLSQDYAEHNSEVDSFLYSGDSIVHTGIIGYASTPYTKPLGITAGLSLQDRGNVEYSTAGSSARDTEAVITSSVNEKGEAVGFDGVPIGVDPAHITYDGAMIYNGAELEDYDHLVAKQAMFIEKNPNVDPNELWNLLEEYNHRRAAGVEVPLDPTLLKHDLELEAHHDKANKQADKEKSYVGAVIGAILGIVGAGALVGGLVVYRRKTRKVK